MLSAKINKKVLKFVKIFPSRSTSRPRFCLKTKTVVSRIRPAHWCAYTHMPMHRKFQLLYVTLACPAAARPQSTAVKTAVVVIYGRGTLQWRPGS